MSKPQVRNLANKCYKKRSNWSTFYWWESELYYYYSRDCLKKLFWSTSKFLVENIIMSSSKKTLWSTFTAIERLFWSTLKFSKNSCWKVDQSKFSKCSKSGSKRLFRFTWWKTWSGSKWFLWVCQPITYKKVSSLLQHTKVDQKPQKAFWIKKIKIRRSC